MKPGIYSGGSPKNKKVEVSKPPSTKGKFVTTNNSKVQELIGKGFHVESQTLIDKVMTYIFKEDKETIEKEA